jgi:predicted nucleic acid-binding protein
MAGLAEVVDLVEQGKAILMTSVLWRVEVLDSSLTPAQKRRIEDAFTSRSIQELSIDSRVMQLAGEIRSFHHAAKSKSTHTAVSTPDAIHLASAIQYGAMEFHTFDGARSGANPGGLLTLSGNVAGHKLKICKPNAVQLRLDFSQQPPMPEGGAPHPE